MSVRGVFGHAAIFGLAPLLQRAAGLVLLPLYTHYLSPADYGEVELLTLAAGLVALVLRLELRPALLRAWVEGDAAVQAGLYRGFGRLLLGLGIIGGAVAFLVSAPACLWLVGHPVGVGTRALVAVGIAIEVAGMVPQAMLQAQLRSRMVVAIGVAQFIVGAGSTVLAVTVLDWGPAGVFLGGTAGLLLGYGAMLAVIGPAGRAPLVAVWPLLRFSLPLLGGALLFFVVRNADRLVVSRVLSVAQLGEYALAWSLAGLLMTMLFLPLQSSLDVWRHRLFADAGGETSFAAVFRIAMAGLALAAVGLNTAGVDLFLEAADARYDAAAALVPALSAAVLLQAGYTIVASAFFVAGATARWTAIFAAGAVVQVGISLLAVPTLGLAGAPLGAVVANAWLYGAAAVWGRRLWAVPFGHGAMAGGLLLVAAAWGARRVASPGSLVGALAVDALVCGVALAIAFGTGMLRRGDVVALLKVRQG